MEVYLPGEGQGEPKGEEIGEEEEPNMREAGLAGVERDVESRSWRKEGNSKN